MSTDRLTFKKLCVHTIKPSELYKHVSTNAENIDEITKKIHWNPHQNIKETEDFIKNIEHEWKNRETATYVIYYNNNFAGLTSLSLEWNKKRGTLGLWLKKSFWGKGISQERAYIMLKLAFEKLDLDIIQVQHVEGNYKSEKSIKKYINKYNGQYDGLLRNETVVNGDLKNYKLYTISCSQYMKDKD